ncbi:hypothetical protein VaNZ11_010592 [Volvox africanus]|uniref:Pherophorin domain-containing protein n=1 Tax=Volvox africanus TaxID=51714 RepID=A0ABQ5S9Q6_9CHLO|nr:hypothetical protein VaNZ11_010592 [Volvox africanus]
MCPQHPSHVPASYNIPMYTRPKVSYWRCLFLCLPPLDLALPLALVLGLGLGLLVLGLLLPPSLPRPEVAAAPGLAVPPPICPPPPPLLVRFAPPPVPFDLAEGEDAALAGSALCGLCSPALFSAATPAANDVTADAASPSSSSASTAGLRTWSIVAPLTGPVTPVNWRFSSPTSAAPLAVTPAPPGRCSAMVAAVEVVPSLTPSLTPTPACGLTAAAPAPPLSGPAASAPPLPSPPPALAQKSGTASSPGARTCSRLWGGGAGVLVRGPSKSGPTRK